MGKVYCISETELKAKAFDKIANACADRKGEILDYETDGIVIGILNETEQFLSLLSKYQLSENIMPERELFADDDDADDSLDDVLPF